MATDPILYLDQIDKSKDYRSFVENRVVKNGGEKIVAEVMGDVAEIAYLQSSFDMFMNPLQMYTEAAMVQKEMDELIDAMNKRDEMRNFKENASRQLQPT